MRVWLASLVAAFILLTQGVALAHAAEHGLDHSHDGVVCDLTVLSEETADVEPPLPAVAVPQPAPVVPHVPRPHGAVDLPALPARAPPVRGPPVPSR